MNTNLSRKKAYYSFNEIINGRVSKYIIIYSIMNKNNKIEKVKDKYSTDTKSI